MATAIRRPVAHEDRLSLTEHLDELRARLIVCVVTLVVAFGFTFWQNGTVLDIVNRPLENTQHLDGTKKSKDPLEQNARFQTATAKAFAAQARSADASARLYTSLASSSSSAPERAAYAAAARAAAGEARAAKAAAAAEPTNKQRQPITLGVAEPFTATTTIALYAALLISLPVVLYQLYAFILPAFAPGERRLALPIMAMVPLLFVAGVAFGYFVVLPRALNFLQNFNDDNFDILIKASDYYKFAVMFVAGIGALFEMPIIVLGITRLGILTPRQLQKNWGYVLLGLAIVAAVVTPTPDPVTMSLALIPLFLLFELSILVSAWLNRVSPPGHWWGENDAELDEQAISYDEED
jgi:sec-independent protein translocase protein TatC